jgi:hypothetical protein
VISGTILVLGGSVTVASRVNGDVIAVNGDIFMHPGGDIQGRAIAIGGCVYQSSLATIAGEQECVRDARYDIHRTAGGVDLRWRPPGMEDLPLFAIPFPGGFRIPTYTRVDGVVLPWGPRISLFSGALDVDPTLVYRSAIGALDASVRIKAGGLSPWFAEIEGGRATRTNDAWIHGDLLNGFLTLVAGRDARNYYRADYGALRAGRRWEHPGAVMRAWVGGQAERAWSARTRGPWSLVNRSDSTEGMQRPNPTINRGRINSALAGGDIRWTSAGLEFVARLEGERAVDAPPGLDFSQATADVSVTFPTFGTQSLTTELHAVATSSDSTPAQRFAYLGGSGTLYTVDLLALGGDQLLYVESRYDIPIESLRIRLLGPPVFSIRYAVGSAGRSSLPQLVQNIGIRVGLALLKVDATLDPQSRDTEFKIGLALSR